jgi:hypothetical protein
MGVFCPNYCWFVQNLDHNIKIAEVTSIFRNIPFRKVQVLATTPVIYELN